jgi:hypothetical protein
MTIKQKTFLLMGIFGISMCFSAFLSSGAVFAVDCDVEPTAAACSGQTADTPQDTPPADEPTESCEASEKNACCGKVKTSVIGGAVCNGAGEGNTAETSTIWRLLIAVLNIMTAGIGIAAVGGIVYGALLYTTAENKPDQTKKAIGIITNVVIGLVTYGLMYVFINFLIPGGVFK